MQKIVKSLYSQLKKNPKVKDPKAAAIAILQKEKILKKDGTLSKYGEKRNAMTPAERRKDRASKR
jgi:hypothetical protein